MANKVPENQMLQCIQIDSLCRLCGNMAINLVSVITEDGKETEMLPKIATHLKISISTEDILPKKLCIHCSNTLISWHNFYQSCQETNEKFHAMLESSKEEVIKETVEILEIQEELEDVVNAEEDEVEMDDEYIEYLDKEESEVEEEDVDLVDEVPKEDILEDARVQLNHFSKDPLEMNCVKEEYVLVSDHDDLPPSVVYDMTMDKDDEVGASEKNLFIRRSGLLICPKCDETFKLRKVFIQHLVKEHGYSETLKKEARIRPEIDANVVKRATVYQDGRVAYKCSQCEKVLKSLDTFVWHRQIHTGVKMFSCYLCSKTFRIQQGLNRHIREFHNREKKYPCDICGRMFLNQRTANEHKRIHTGAMPFKCEECGKSFKQKAGLYIHRKSHNAIPEFHCAVCQQGFRMRYALMLHMKIHTGDREHECEVCQRKFRLKAELQRHRMLHGNENPFECPKCEKSFRVKRYLKRHMQQHHVPEDE